MSLFLRTGMISVIRIMQMAIRKFGVMRLGIYRLINRRSMFTQPFYAGAIIISIAGRGRRMTHACHLGKKLHGEEDVKRIQKKSWASLKFLSET